MKKTRIYFRIFLAILFLGMMPACTYDTIHVGGVDSDVNVTLALKLGDQTLVASRGNDTQFNENVIETVDLFFFKNLGNGNYSTISDVEVLDITTINDAGVVSFTMNVNDYNTLFPNNTDTKCQVYAIVNRGDNSLPTKTTDSSDNTKSGYTIASLQGMGIDATFLEEEEVTVEGKKVIKYTPKTADSFVMEGPAVEITRSGTNLTGTIDVQRIAAKITLRINGIDETEADGTTWVPDPTSVKVSLRKGLKHTALASAYTPEDDDIFNIEEYALTSKPETKDGKEHTIWESTIPFYTYPTNWEKNSDVNTHIILTVTWKDKATTNKKADRKTYYGVNINPGESKIERNKHYILTQHISVLGTENENETPLELTPSYKVLLDWGEGGSGSNLFTYKYLVVDETAITLQNVPRKRIYFTSSDDIDLNDVTVKWDYVKGTTTDFLTMATKEDSSPAVYTGEGSYTISTQDTPIYSNNSAATGVTNRVYGSYGLTIEINNAEKYIEVTHPLNNNMQSTSDYTRYQIELKVAHVGDTQYNETIKITQYPMLCVEGVKNTDYISDSNRNSHWGYVYINGAGYVSQQNNSTGSGWYYVGGWPNNNSISNNPNKYIVTVSSLADNSVGKNYIIGDPRRTTPWSDSEIASDINKTINSTTLDNYYPTNRNAASGLISPQFMVASSYGYCNNTITSIEDAEKRCATYQEDGYPAGRWRVPTQAEVKYMIQLSEWGTIPKLFSNNTWYWSAQGAVQYIGEGNFNGPTYNETSVRVRCVYDTWYWGRERVDDTLSSFQYLDENPYNTNN